MKYIHCELSNLIGRFEHITLQFFLYTHTEGSEFVLVTIATCLSFSILFQVTSLGFVGQALEGTVNGIVRSIKLAHDSMKPASLSLGMGTLDDANINRSPSAYLNNPEDERSK